MVGESGNSLTIIVPTCGRKTLPNTLLSFAKDVRDGDVVYVISDGPRAGLSFLLGYLDCTYPGRWRSIPGPYMGGWGHGLRNLLLRKVVTDYVWTIDDDDVAAPGALDAFRGASAPWIIYRMKFESGHPANGITCWREKRLQHGDIGTPMILARPSNARFGEDYSGDWGYVQGLHAEFGDPEWDETVVALIRPEEVDE